ncbi:unnamed protein product [Lactuca virosa]|uniref:Uncharacterized protein n=1 Tax=Lactuca virosa TaxID=75947 RepID=A0AAU9LQA6_9ASTR|nr:unnamed protein product [Lactuca virosa]
MVYGGKIVGGEKTFCRNVNVRAALKNARTNYIAAKLGVKLAAMIIKNLGGKLSDRDKQTRGNHLGTFIGNTQEMANKRLKNVGRAINNRDGGNTS